MCWTHGRSRVLLCALQGRHAFAEWRRLGGFQQPGPFAPVWLPRHGLVKRLGQAGLAPLQERWETLNGRRAHPAPWAVSATVAPVAPEIFARDETRLDALGRSLKPLGGLSTHDAACGAGKRGGLFALPRQRCSRRAWRKDVHAQWRVDMLDFLQGRSAPSLLLFALGSFSVPFFETGTDRNLWWGSRDRENTSSCLAHVFSRHREKLDALICLGTGKKQARHLMRMVRLGDGVGVRVSLTTSGDPPMLALGDVAHLQARRGEREMAFRLLKEELGLSHGWSSTQELILVQLWVVRIRAHLGGALRERIAQAQDGDPCDVSVPVSGDGLPRRCRPSSLPLEQLMQAGHHLGLLRANPRLERDVPQGALSWSQPAPPDVLRPRPGRALPRPRRRASPPATRVGGYQVQRQRRQASTQAQAIRAAQAKTSQVDQLPMAVT